MVKRIFFKEVDGYFLTLDEWKRVKNGLSCISDDFCPDPRYTVYCGYCGEGLVGASDHKDDCIFGEEWE